MQRFLCGCRIFTGEAMVSGQGVLVRDGAVVALAAQPPAGVEIERLPEDGLLAPGFLDLQVNGAGGVLFNAEPTPEGVRTIARTVRRFGVTAVLPTFITGPREAMLAACAATAQVAAEPGSGVIGIHLEGPFISPERPGIHDPAWIRPPDAADIDGLIAAAGSLAAAGARLLLTVAPEMVEDSAIARLAAAGIILSAGHTAASFERSEAALAAGLRGFTHLGNAMPPINNRAPGPVAAALASPDAWFGLIADGRHVHPGLMRVMAAAKPPGKLFLVTDAMPPLGTDMTSFMLDGRPIWRRDGRLVSTEGVLAGADLDMAQAVRNAMSLLGRSLPEALRMASLYPAAFLGLDDRRGRIAPGCRADLILLGPDLDVRRSWIAGTL